MPIFIDVFHEFYGTAIVPTFIDIVPFLINIVPTYNLFLLYLRQMRMFQKSMPLCLRIFCLTVVVSQMCFHVVTSAVFVITKLTLNKFLLAMS